MTPRTLVMSRSFQMAAGAVLVALGTAAWTASRALSIEPVPTVPPPTFATEAALAPRGMAVPVDIGGVVSMNAFSPDRRAPARRYRLSGYADPAPPAAPPPEPLVIGTSVASGGRSFAYCTVGGGPPTIVRVGEKIGGFTVRSIERGRVVFTTPSGESLTVNAR